MTLARWQEKYNVKVRPYGKPYGGVQALHVFSDDSREHAEAGWDLHHLQDYAVSSHVSGPACVLAPRHGHAGSGKSRFGS